MKEIVTLWREESTNCFEYQVFLNEIVPGVGRAVDKRAKEVRLVKDAMNECCQSTAKSLEDWRKKSALRQLVQFAEKRKRFYPCLFWLARKEMTKKAEEVIYKISSNFSLTQISNLFAAEHSENCFYVSLQINQNFLKSMKGEF